MLDMHEVAGSIPAVSTSREPRCAICVWGFLLNKVLILASHAVSFSQHFDKTGTAGLTVAVRHMGCSAIWVVSLFCGFAAGFISSMTRDRALKSTACAVGFYLFQSMTANFSIVTESKPEFIFCAASAAEWRFLWTP